MITIQSYFYPRYVPMEHEDVIDSNPRNQCHEGTNKDTGIDLNHINYFPYSKCFAFRIFSIGWCSH